MSNFGGTDVQIWVALLEGSDRNGMNFGIIKLLPYKLFRWDLLQISPLKCQVQTYKQGLFSSGIVAVHLTLISSSSAVDNLMWKKA